MPINPKAALGALLAGPIEIRPGLSVAPLSLALYAKLDAIDCPYFAGGESRCRALEMLPSFYLVTHPEAPLAGLAEAAQAWAQGLPWGIFPALTAAFLEQVRLAEAVVPATVEADGPKAATAG